MADSIRLFATQAHPCSYLPDKEATTIFIDPDYQHSQHSYSVLSEQGFRRSGDHVYKPQCQSCNACMACRVRAHDFKPNRSQRRVFKANKDLTVSVAEQLDMERYFPLYERYINQRHSDGDMYPASQDQLESFLTQAWGTTRYIEFSSPKKLLAVAVVDFLDDAMSAIYTFFDPEENSRSLGNLAILWQLQYAKRLAIPWVYLGYWIKDCDKMNYKQRYQPLQIHHLGEWKDFSALPIDAI